MAFSFPTVNPDFDARSAIEDDANAGVDTSQDDDATSENGAEHDSEADDTQETEGADDAAGGDAEVGANDASGRSQYVSRKNFDKVNARLRELEAQTANAPSANPWEPAIEALQGYGYQSPEQLIDALDAQREQVTRAQIEEEVSQQIDPDMFPDQHADMVRIKQQLATQQNYLTSRVMRDVVKEYPDADLETMQVFGTNPEMIEKIARHTHTRVASVRAAMQKDFDTQLEAARTQARLDLLAEQKKKAPRTETASGAGNTPAAGNTPRKPGSGFAGLFPMRRTSG